ncbi:MAG: carboxymuconolactone decarboxylase family protein [Pseudonocardiaceae bacterium]
MAHLPSLPERAVLLDVFRAYPDTARPLLDYHEALMRGDSPLTVAERELIAAFVSALNACSYCHGVHQATARRFGVAEGILEGLLEDVETAAVEERLRPLLSYVAKLTVEPSRVGSHDAQAVMAAGWSEQALFDSVAVCGLFNLMNRLVEGLGVAGDEQYFGVAADRLADGGYAGLKDLL